MLEVKQQEARRGEYRSMQIYFSSIWAAKSLGKRAFKF